MLFVDRYKHQREGLRALLREHKPDKVGIESPAFGEGWSEGMYGLFLYSNEALSEEGVDVVFIAIGQVKAHAREFLGRPMKPRAWKMTKADMCEAAREDTGGAGRWNHNEADAYLVAKLAGRFWELETGGLHQSDLTDVERHQFTKIHKYTRGKRAGTTEVRGILFREEDRFFRWSEARHGASEEGDEGSDEGGGER